MELGLRLPRLPFPAPLHSEGIEKIEQVKLATMESDGEITVIREEGK